MTDILLSDQTYGGDVAIEHGYAGPEHAASIDLALEQWLSTAVYLSLFGGNVEDDGSSATAHRQFWGNRVAENADAEVRSSMIALIGSSSLNTALLDRAEKAAANDLAWMLRQGLVQGIVVECTLPALDTIAVSISLVVGEQTLQLGYRYRNAA